MICNILCTAEYLLLRRTIFKFCRLRGIGQAKRSTCQPNMRTLFDIIGQTLQTLWAHKLRSFLTMFGIAWGVGSLLLLVGLGEGFRSGNVKQLSTLGENIVWVNGGWVPPLEGSHQKTRPYQ